MGHAGEIEDHASQVVLQLIIFGILGMAVMGAIVTLAIVAG
jgi:hypothetical protein